MTMADLLMVLAVLVSPLIAVQVTRWIDVARDNRARRNMIFRVLMATRAAGLSADHVNSLNLVPVDFDSAPGRDKRVIEAWKAYLAHLNDRNFPQDQWSIRREDLLIELLYEMSRRLRYDFDKTHIKTGVYSPAAHSELEDDMRAIRKHWRDILEGRRILPMYITNLPPLPQQVDPPEDDAAS